MCGICGKLIFDQSARVEPPAIYDMLQTIAYRGPDDDGVYVSGPVGMGHKRLSIIDLASGHQPLSDDTGRYWIVFNGEIYNYQELREYLSSKGHAFKTKTDTEVIVQLYAELGVRCLEKLRGMFAFAIWDSKEHSLFLARDRVGIKPLYYSLSGDALVFASEIKAILADPEITADVEPAIIDRFLTFYYVPGEETLFRGIRKLPAASYMIVKNGRAEIHRYWDLQFAEPLQGEKVEYMIERLLSLLHDTIKLHMISDVPVGVLLSGGVDSTAVLSFASKRTDRELSTYTVGFSGTGVPDERPFARLAAQKYGSRHHEITISADDFLDFLPTYVWHMEEPVCEPPAIALFYVSKLASKYVKVLISGEGGDEAFAGYVNYRYNTWLERLKVAFGPFRKQAATSFLMANRFLASQKLAKYIARINVPFDDYYYSLTSDPQHLFNRALSEVYTPEFLQGINKHSSLAPIKDYLASSAGQCTLSRMQYVDIKSWLPDDLLIKADRMTMANSIELRVPFLDHKLLEFASSLPANLRMRGATTKYILKKALRQHGIPSEILDRPKAGFPVPYDSWFKSELKSWLHDLLLDRRTVERGYFHKSAIERMLNGTAAYEDRGKDLFCLAVLELWHRTFLEKEFHHRSVRLQHELAAQA